METSAAFGCESYAIIELWKERKGRPAPDIESVEEFHENAFKIIGQIMFGTKLKRGGTAGDRNRTDEHPHTHQ